MTMVADSRGQDEALIRAARASFTDARQRSERVCFYRTPMVKPDGGRHVQGGWICWGDTQQGIKLGKIARGYIPLEQYGYIQAKRRDDDPDGPFERYGPWGVILSQPDGVLEFPKEQILAFHWYDADRLRQSLNGEIPPTLKVRDGMVLWPQLAGADLRIFACPECSDWRALEAVFLARHLRIWHEYGQADILAFGQQYGVDFSAEMNRDGRVIRAFSFEAPPDDEPDADEQALGFSLDIARPTRGRTRKESMP